MKFRGSGGAPGVLAALLTVGLLLHSARGRALQEDYSSLAEQVKSACPSYSFYGEDFLMDGCALILVMCEIAEIGATHSPAAGGLAPSLLATVSAGRQPAECHKHRFGGRLLLQLHRRLLQVELVPNNECQRLHCIRRAPERHCLPGRHLPAQQQHRPEQHHAHHLQQAEAGGDVGRRHPGRAGHHPRDRRVGLTGAGLHRVSEQRGAVVVPLPPGGQRQPQAVAADNASETGPQLSQGQQVNYTGVQLDDGSGNTWAVVLAGDGPELYMYPANDLAFCPQGGAGGHQQCTANLFGSATEEGGSCTQDSDCCSSLLCKPRAVGDIVLLWPTYAGADRSQNFSISPGQAWSALPNECVRKYSDLGGPTTYIATTWNTDNTTTQCAVFNLTALQNNDTDLIWTKNASSTWTAPEGNLLVDDSEVQAYRDQLCASLDTANATLAADVAAEGADAQKAYLAMFVGSPDGGPYQCPQGVLLAQLFVNYANGPGSTVSSLTGMAQHFVDAAASTGSAACVNIAVLDASQSQVLQTYEIHTPAGAATGLLPNGTVRLSGSDSCTQGTVDVIMAGSWGAVCFLGDGGDAVNQPNAQVVCRGQGLPSEQPSVSAEASRAGAYVWIRDLNCTGSERSILDCPHTMADGSSAGSEDCLALSITCADAANAEAAASAMCTERPGRCQTLPGNCDPAQGYCSFKAQPAGTPCLGGMCDASGQCMATASS
ncbi:hypothetical protein ABPG75_005675 [Micractinium tetrahymenae]